MVLRLDQDSASQRRRRTLYFAANCSYPVSSLIHAPASVFLALPSSGENLLIQQVWIRDEHQAHHRSHHKAGKTFLFSKQERSERAGQQLLESEHAPRRIMPLCQRFTEYMTIIPTVRACFPLENSYRDVDILFALGAAVNCS